MFADSKRPREAIKEERQRQVLEGEQRHLTDEMDNNTMLAGKEICKDVTESLEALPSDQSETGKCNFVDIV
jgi:hypothetical protein